MKKFIIPILLLLNFIAAAFVIQVLFENDWVCENGQWINHGGIFSRQPNEPCTDVYVGAKEQKLGGDRDEHGCIGSAGYTWCEEKQKCLRIWEEPCTQEEVFELLSKLKTETEINFAGIANAEMEWNLATDSAQSNYTPVTIQAKKISAVNIDKELLEQVTSFFLEQGFTRDVYNISAGTVVSSTGYSDQRFACLVKDTLSNFDPEEHATPEQRDLIDIEVICGES